MVFIFCVSFSFDLILCFTCFLMIFISIKLKNYSVVHVTTRKINFKHSSLCTLLQKQAISTINSHLIRNYIHNLSRYTTQPFQNIKLGIKQVRKFGTLSHEILDLFVTPLMVFRSIANPIWPTSR